MAKNLKPFTLESDIHYLSTRNISEDDRKQTYEALQRIGYDTSDLILNPIYKQFHLKWGLPLDE